MFDCLYKRSKHRRTHCAINLWLDLLVVVVLDYYPFVAVAPDCLLQSGPTPLRRSCDVAVVVGISALPSAQRLLLVGSMESPVMQLDRSPVLLLLSLLWAWAAWSHGSASCMHRRANNNSRDWPASPCLSCTHCTTCHRI